MKKKRKKLNITLMLTQHSYWLNVLSLINNKIYYLENYAPTTSGGCSGER